MFCSKCKANFSNSESYLSKREYTYCLISYFISCKSCLIPVSSLYICVGIAYFSKHVQHCTYCKFRYCCCTSVRHVKYSYTFAFCVFNIYVIKTYTCHTDSFKFYSGIYKRFIHRSSRSYYQNFIVFYHFFQFIKRFSICKCNANTVFFQYIYTGLIVQFSYKTFH